MRSCEAQRLWTGLVDGWLGHCSLDGLPIISANRAGHKVGCSGGGLRGVAKLPGCGVSQGLLAGGVAGGFWTAVTAGGGVRGLWCTLAEKAVSLLSICGGQPQRLRAGGVGAGWANGVLCQRGVDATLQAACKSPAAWCRGVSSDSCG